MQQLKGQRHKFFFFCISDDDCGSNDDSTVRLYYIENPKINLYSKSKVLTDLREGNIGI